MSENVQTAYEQFLNQHDAAAWAAMLAELTPAIHEVDRHATAIWFAFYPLALQRALAKAEDPDRLVHKLLLQGKYALREQIDTSHVFLYGHRFWPQAKRAVERHAAAAGGTEGLTLAAEIKQLVGQAAREVQAPASLLVGITAVALMTLQQVGFDAFKAAPGRTQLNERDAHRSPEQVLRERARDDAPGMFGFLKTTNKSWTVIWNEADRAARFSMFDRQEIATAAASDQRDWSQVDERCTIGEGPIPVQCRSASCATCWVGVLGGAEKLSPLSDRERRILRDAGYLDTEAARPLIRLSCQAQGTGALSIVIPPWNGFFGKYLREEKQEA